MTPTSRLFAPAALLVVAAGGASAQGYSLLIGQGLFVARPPLYDMSRSERSPLPTARQPLIRSRAEMPDTAAAEEARGRAQSLFAGRTRGSLFAPFAAHDRRSSRSSLPAYASPLGDDPQAAMIRQLVAYAEAGRDGYDAVQYGATRRPDRRPTQMTLDDIFGWIRATPGQPHAIGRYQFIPATLARLVDTLGAGSQQPFSPELQDRLADLLLQEAGLADYRSGLMTRHEFMNNLAKIWAGLPNSSGLSAYEGYAGNAASITWAQFDHEMERIFEG